MERDENQENILEDIIRGPEDVGDVTSQFLNNSGEGDESLNRRDGSAKLVFSYVRAAIVSHVKVENLIQRFLVQVISTWSLDVHYRIPG